MKTIYFVKIMLVIALFFSAARDVSTFNITNRVINKKSNYLNLSQTISKETITTEHLKEIIKILLENGTKEEVSAYLEMLESMSPRIALLLKTIKIIDESSSINSVPRRPTQNALSFISIPIQKFLDFSSLTVKKIQSLANPKIELRTKEKVVTKFIKADLTTKLDMVKDNEYFKTCIKLLNIIALRAVKYKDGYLLEQFPCVLEERNEQLGKWFRELVGRMQKEARYGIENAFTDILKRMLEKDKFGKQSVEYIYRNSTFPVKNFLYEMINNRQELIDTDTGSRENLIQAVLYKLACNCEECFEFILDFDETILTREIESLRKRDISLFGYRYMNHGKLQESVLSDHMDSKNMIFLEAFIGDEFVRQLVEESLKTKSMHFSELPILAWYVEVAQSLDRLLKDMDDTVYIAEVAKFFRRKIENKFNKNNVYNNSYQYVLMDFFKRVADYNGQRINILNFVNDYIIQFDMSNLRTYFKLEQDYNEVHTYEKQNDGILEHIIELTDSQINSKGLALHTYCTVCFEDKKFYFYVEGKGHGEKTYSALDCSSDNQTIRRFFVAFKNRDLEVMRFYVENFYNKPDFKVAIHDLLNIYIKLDQLEYVKVDERDIDNLKVIIDLLAQKDLEFSKEIELIKKDQKYIDYLFNTFLEGRYKEIRFKAILSKLRNKDVVEYLAVFSLLFVEIKRINKPLYKEIMFYLKEDMKDYKAFIKFLDKYQDVIIQDFEKNMIKYFIIKKIKIDDVSLLIDKFQKIILNISLKYAQEEMPLTKYLEYIYSTVLKRYNMKVLSDLKEKALSAKNKENKNLVEALERTNGITQDQKIKFFLKGVFKGKEIKELTTDKEVLKNILNLIKDEHNILTIIDLGEKCREALLGAFESAKSGEYEIELFLKLFLKDISKHYKKIVKDFSESKTEYNFFEYYACIWFGNNFLFGTQKVSKDTEVVSIHEILDDPLGMFYIVNSIECFNGYAESELVEKIKNYIEFEIEKPKDVLLGLLLSDRPQIFRLLYKNEDLEEYIIYKLLDNEPDKSFNAPSEDLSSETIEILTKELQLKGTDKETKKKTGEAQRLKINLNDYLKERFGFVYEKYKMSFLHAANIAACLGHMDRLKILLQLGVDVNKRYENVKDEDPVFYNSWQEFMLLGVGLKSNLMSIEKEFKISIIGFKNIIKVSREEMVRWHKQVMKLLVQNGAIFVDANYLNGLIYSNKQSKKMIESYEDEIGKADELLQLGKQFEAYISELKIVHEESEKNTIKDIFYRVKRYVKYKYEKIYGMVLLEELKGIIDIIIKKLIARREQLLSKSREEFRPIEIRCITKLTLAV